MLAKYIVKEESHECPILTPVCVCIQQIIRHESTKFTPFELMFGCTAFLPIDVDMEKKSPSEFKETRYLLMSNNYQQQK